MNGNRDHCFRIQVAPAIGCIISLFILVCGVMAEDQPADTMVEGRIWAGVGLGVCSRRGQQSGPLGRALGYLSLSLAAPPGTAASG